MTADFRDPLFVVGCSRSGTKLLRTLLNNHPQIEILGVETNFIPLFVERFGKAPDFSDEATLRSIYDALTQTPFYQTYQAAAERAMPYDHLKTHLRDAEKTEALTWRHLIEGTFRFYLKKPSVSVWGDKSPSYTAHMPLLKEIFPQSRFVHIIRDPRDRSLSMRKAWGKNVLRSAQGWYEDMERVERANVRADPNYLEVFYEQLLEAPEEVIQRVCDFLGVPFDPSLLVLKRSAENIGTAKGQKEIVAGNTRKYLTELSTYEIRRTSEITYPYLQAFGYPLEGAQAHRELSPRRQHVLKLTDGLATLNMHMKEKGVVRGLRYYVQRNREGRARA